MTAQFDLNTHILSVEVIHIVGGESTNHYVEGLQITHNRESVIEQKTKRQLSDIQTFLYFMPAVGEGDEIEIIADCSLFGQRSANITVEDEDIE